MVKKEVEAAPMKIDEMMKMKDLAGKALQAKVELAEKKNQEKETTR